MKKILSLIIVISVLLTIIQIDVYATDSIAEKMYEEGMAFFEQEDYDRAFAHFQISGEVKGYAPAQNMLGICYRDGLGTEPDIAEAERCFRLSAEQGCIPAQENLSLIISSSEPEEILVDNDKLAVMQMKDNSLHITLKNIEIKDPFSIKEQQSYRVDFYKGDLKEFDINTTFTRSGISSVLYKTIHIDERTSQWEKYNVEMTHTGTSITWEINLDNTPIDFPAISFVRIYIEETGSSRRKNSERVSCEIDGGLFKVALKDVPILDDYSKEPGVPEASYISYSWSVELSDGSDTSYSVETSLSGYPMKGDTFGRNDFDNTRSITKTTKTMNSSSSHSNSSRMDSTYVRISDDTITWSLDRWTFPASYTDNMDEITLKYRFMERFEYDVDPLPEK